jgi:mediator of RNA polymerase II transcription subunit 5
MSMSPPNYTHRLVLLATKLLGARRVLLSIVEEIKSLSAQSSEPIAMDVATAIICAPDVPSLSSTPAFSGLGMSETHVVTYQGRMNLRDALKLEMDGVSKLHKSDPLAGEVLVRLSRRVDALVGSAQPGLIDAGVGVSVGVNAVLDNAGSLGMDAGMGEGLGLDGGMAGMGPDVAGDMGMMGLGGGDELMGGMMS